MKIKKVITIFILFMLCISLFYNIAEAFTISTPDITASGGGQAKTKIGKFVTALVTVARIIAAGIAIIMLVVVAMKYMLAAPGDRADIKKSAVAYIVGALVLFGASGILTIIDTFSDNVHT